MTITVLASFSLLALVVSARPLLPNQAEYHQSSPNNAAIQDVVQAIYQANVDPSLRLSFEADPDVHVHLTSPKQQEAVLSELDGIGQVKSLIPIGQHGTLTDDEKKLRDILTASSSNLADSLDALDGGFVEDSDPLETNSEEPHVQDRLTFSTGANDTMIPVLGPPLIPLALSAFAALMMLGLVSILLYGVTCYHRSHPTSDNHDSEECLKVEKSHHPFPSAQTGEKFDEKASSTQLPTYSTLVSHSVAESVVDSQSIGEARTVESELQTNDSAEDAFKNPEDLPLQSTLIAQPILNHQAPDPDYLRLPEASSSLATPMPTPPATPKLHFAQMRESSSTSSPVVGSTYSIRTSQAPTVGNDDSHESPPVVKTEVPMRHMHIPGELPLESESDLEVSVHQTQRSRTGVSSHPELDLAFAMQLRPGFGLGADAAWLVRFLMAMFGWMTVLVGSGRGAASRRESRQAIAAA